MLKKIAIVTFLALSFAIASTEAAFAKSAKKAPLAPTPHGFCPMGSGPWC